MKKYVEHMNWMSILHQCFIVIFLTCSSFYLLMTRLLTKKEMSVLFQNSHQLLFLMYLISVFIIAVYVSKIITKRFLSQLALCYILYQVISYVILVTRNLNNRHFKVWDFWKNHFWEGNALPTLFIILVLAFLIKQLMLKTDYLNEVTIFLKDSKGHQFILSMLLGIVAVLDSKWVHYLREQLLPILTSDGLMNFLSALFKFLLVSLFAFSTIAYIVIDSSEKMRKNQPSLSLAISTSLLLSLIFNYTLQYGVKTDSDLLGYYVFPGATLYQFSVLALFFLFIYLLINRYISTTLILIVLGTILSVVNILKFNMRSEPLLLTDFVWLHEVNLLLSFLDTKIIFYIVLIFLLPLVVYLIFRNRFLAGKLILKKRVRISLLVLLVTIFSLRFAILKNEKEGKFILGIPVASKVDNRMDITWMGFSTNARYRSLMYVWTQQLTKTVMEMPEGYNQEAVEKLAKKYEAKAKEINKSRGQDISDQTVIYVLSESLANPNRISGVSLSKDVLPNINQIKEGTTSGLMHSDGYGGGTANMEFQTLTGLPFSNFSPSVSVLYSEVVPKLSIFPSISDNFDAKNRFVMHPSGANNYDRINVYKKLGFEHLIFESESKEKFSNVRHTGVSMSDDSLYENILNKIDVKQSQFFSIITMQNHAPWAVGNPVEVTGTGQGFTDDENGKLTEYARLLTHTDRATAQFISSLSKIDKKITVVFYGDHLPGLYPDSAFKDNLDVKYETDYFIWSNWQDKKLNYPLVKSSDFIAELFAHMDSKVSPYYALLTEVLDKVTNSNDRSSKEQESVQHDLKLLQYDITVGKGYLKKDKKFFETPK